MPAPLTESRPTDLFVSYARNDESFVHRLSDALAKFGKQLWVDRQSILPAAEWLEEIRSGIRSAHTFIFVISSASVASQNCLAELALAVELKKRLITVICSEVANPLLPEALRPVQWIDLHSADFSPEHLQPLLSVIDKDLDWLRQNIRWDLRAKEWEQYGRDPGFLLSGVELTQSEEWLAKGVSGVLHPSELQIQYVAASAKAAAERFSNNLAEQAQRNLKGRQDLSLLLSVEACRSAETIASRRSLVNALQANPYLFAWLRTLEGGLTCVAFTPNGQFVAAGNKQGSIFLWDVASRAQRAVLRYRPPGAFTSGSMLLVESLAFSPDGLSIAAAIGSEIALWGYQSGQQIGVIQGTAAPVNGIAYSPNSQLLAWAANDGKVRILPLISAKVDPHGTIAFSVDSGKILDAHPRRVSSVCFSPDGSLLVSVGEDIRLWDVAGFCQIGEPLTRHADWIPTVAFSPDGRLLASGSLDGTVILWDTATRQPVCKPLVHDFWGVTAVAFSPDGTKLASTARDGSIALWDLPQRTRLNRLEGHDGLALRITFSPTLNLLASAGSDGAVILWDVTNYSTLRRDIPTNSQCVSAVGFSADHQMYASGGWDGIITVAKLGKTPQPPVHLVHQQKITSLSFSFDSKFLVSSTYGWLIHLWDPESGEKLGELAGHSGSLPCVRFSPVANIFASASMDSSVILWDAATRERIGEPVKQSSEPVMSLDFSPDGKLLAMGTQSGAVLVLDIATRTLLCEPLTAHTKAVTSLAFHPTGRSLFSGSLDETIRNWNTRNWKPQGMPSRAFALQVMAMAVSPIGDALASCHNDGSIQLWDGHSDDHIAEFRTEYRSAVHCVTFSPNGQVMVVGICTQEQPGICSTGKLLFFDISLQSWKTHASRLANRDLSSEERGRYLAI